MITLLVCGGRDFGDLSHVPIKYDDNFLVVDKSSPKWKDKILQYRYIVRKILDFCFDLNLVDANSSIDGLRIISGAATGADSVALDFAKDNWLSFKEYPAEWSKHGKAAGPIRNAEMLEKENVTNVMAFPGGKGTADMIKKAKDRGIPILDYRKDYDNIVSSTE